MNSSSNGAPSVLVTGGAGFIGSHVCRQLSAIGYLPVTLDNFSSGHGWAVKYGPCEQGDIRSREALDRVFETHRPIAVCHLAADIEVGASVEEPDAHYRNNVGGTLELLSAMHRWDVERLVFASTCAVYGNPDRQPISEDQTPAPANPYGRGKLICEQMIDDFAAAYGLKAISLRFFNASGATPEHGLGEAREHETHLIPLALDAALEERTFVVNGDDYATADGTCVRDYLHVEDIASAHVQSMTALEAFPPGRTAAYNLSTGEGYSVLQVLDTIDRVTGTAVARRIGPRRPGDVAVLVGSAARAAAELGWRAQCSDLDTIVDSAWRWRKLYHGAPAPSDLSRSSA